MPSCTWAFVSTCLAAGSVIYHPQKDFSPVDIAHKLLSQTGVVRLLLRIFEGVNFASMIMNCCDAVNRYCWFLPLSFLCLP